MLVGGFTFSNNQTIAAANDFAVGTTVEDFKLVDTNGKEKSFNDLKGKNGAIVVFLSVQCPVVRAYDERINKIAEDYQAQGINFIGINSNVTESMEQVKKHAAEKYKFPVLIDKGNAIADKFSASATPEMFFFDGKNKLVYHGAIDNDRSGANVTENFLRVALDENLAGKPITRSQTKAFGCSIKRVGM
jgi:peroxiredoxin